jgi:hypothetical protein
LEPAAVVTDPASERGAFLVVARARWRFNIRGYRTVSGVNAARMTGIFADDAPLDARRETALATMLAAMPAAFRIPMRPQLTQILEAMTEQQVTQAIADLQAAREAAQRNDLDGMLELARHWASDEQIRAYMPQLQAMMKQAP